MKKLEQLAQYLQSELMVAPEAITIAHGDLTLECLTSELLNCLQSLRDHKKFLFDQLIDVCGVDYLHYGQYDWETEAATEFGFSRGVERGEEQECTWSKPRFAVVYHLLSTVKNHRLRVKVFLSETNLIIPSICDLYKAADWFERETYDLFGILFAGHPDLRRILTDYGFIGHPFRKDFPLSGHVEMQYDAQLQKVIYVPVDITPRVNVPKVIRDDNRYLTGDEAVPHD